MPVLHMNLGVHSYDITIERGVLRRAGELLNLNRRVFILTDEGVPSRYSKTVADQCAKSVVVCLPSGEQNKCPENWVSLLRTMLENDFDRHDCVVAVGGGVIGDLAGFVAASYMRGIDFYNIPTTLLSQVDSSVGGKVAIDLDGYKNTVGAFWQPKAVLIDPDVLSTLDERQIGCGMAEAIKMMATFDRAAFEEMEKCSDMPIDKIIENALKIKMGVVEKDEKEAGLRAVLNFGHTVGHAIEHISASGEHPLLHGECVAIGMLCVTEGEVNQRIRALLERYHLPTSFVCRREDVVEAVTHDKKAAADMIKLICVPEIGTYTIQKLSAEAIVNGCGEALKTL